MSRRERLAWIVLGAVVLALRLVDLGARPPHHDEAVHAHFAHQLLVNGAYRYDPTYHGPLLFYVTASVFAVLGESVTTARLYPALAGAGLVLLPLALRRRVGARAAWWTGLVLAISPTFTYYSRFARNDVPVALFTAAALVLFLRVRRSGWRPLPFVGVAAALHAVSKETFYVTVPLLGAGGAAVAVRVGAAESVRRVRGWLARFAGPLTMAVLWFVAICATAYTFVFIHPDDLFFPFKAIRYWYEQHAIQRVGGPWFYHLPRLALYEFLIVGAALWRVVRRQRRLRRVELFCLAWGGASVAMYAYLGEKVPWLMVHQVLPFALLAGAELADVWSRRERLLGKVAAGVLLAGTVWSTVSLTFLHPTITTSSPHAEMLVFVQTSPEAEELARKGLALQSSDRDPVLAAVAGEAAWPLSWQWRDLSVWWGLPQGGSRPPLVVCNLLDETTVEEILGAGYSKRVIPLRAWWVEEWRRAGVREIVRWFITRWAWSPIGATEIAVFERHDGGAGGVGGKP